MGARALSPSLIPFLCCRKPTGDTAEYSLIVLGVQKRFLRALFL
jgi:hypothetical protein